MSTEKIKPGEVIGSALEIYREQASVLLSAAIAVFAIVALARSLGLEIIAEGVETKEQLAFINELTCERVQGYYFSRPIPAREIVGLQGLRAG